jgi:hypothetical protein
MPDAKFCRGCGAAQTEGEAAPAEVFEPEAAMPVVLANDVRPIPPPANDVRHVPPQKIENHLVKSVIATACCCIPFGIVGIIYAAKVDTLLRQGDRAAAAEASKKAGLWSNLAIGVGLLVNLLMITLMIVYEIKDRLIYP